MLETANISSLSATEIQAYKFILDNISIIPSLGISELAKRAFCSNACIIRLLKKLGYASYSDFKYSIKQSLYTSSTQEIYNTHHAKDKIKAIFDSLDNSKILKICEFIKNSSAIYIYGRNMSSVPAKYMHEVLMSLDYPSILLEWKDVLLPLSNNSTENDLIILFTEHMHKAYFPVINNFSKNKSKIVWISNSRLNSSIANEISIFIHANEIDTDETQRSSKLVSLLIVQLILDQIG